MRNDHRTWAKQYVAGKGSREIAANAGVSHMTVLRAMREMQVSKPDNTDRDAAIREAVAAGETQEAVGKRYGLTRQRVSQIVKGEQP